MYKMYEGEDCTFWHTVQELWVTEDKGKLMAMVWHMWSNYDMGYKLPDYFNDWMIKAEKKLGFSVAKENLKIETDKYLAEQKNKG